MNLSADDSLTPKELFHTEKLLEIEIKVDKKNWDTMRMEHHDLVQFMGKERINNPDPEVYHYVEADLAINGQWFHSVGIRKKGFLGSASYTRPSIKVKFNEFVKDQRLDGVSRLTLNNNNQDPSQLNQYLTYRVFRQAGIPAPRCNLAHVTVNGESLGIYSHVESVRKDFIEEHFKDKDGNLYEGVAGADFEASQIAFYQKKTNRSKNNKKDLIKVVEAMKTSDASLVNALDPLIDIDQFLRFWVVETLTGHWDGYTDDRNNYYIYNDPSSGKFHFIPWGPDSAFGQPNPFRTVEMPESVKAVSVIPKRLYKIPSTRKRYRNVFREIMNETWNEKDLLGEIDRLLPLIRSKLHVPEVLFSRSIESIKQYIKSRRELIMAELDAPAADVDFPNQIQSFMEKKGSMSLTFETTWSDQPDPNPFKIKPTKWELTISDEPYAFIQQGVRAVPQQRDMRFGQPTIHAMGLLPNSGKLTIAAFTIEPEFYKSGNTVPVDGYTCAGWVVEVPLTDVTDYRVIGMLQGSLTLNHAGIRPGEKVSGEAQCDVYLNME